MTEEQRREDSIKQKMILTKLVQRITATPSIKAAAARQNISPSDYLWDLHGQIAAEVEQEFMRMKTLQLKTEFLRSEFERKHGKPESLRSQTARLRREFYSKRN